MTKDQTTDWGIDKGQETRDQSKAQVLKEARIGMYAPSQVTSPWTRLVTKDQTRYQEKDQGLNYGLERALKTGQ